MSIDKIITFDGPYTEDKYNQFFNPNICHVCKLPSTHLITCNQCCMISYCSKKHEKIHEDSHLELCRDLANMITDKSEWNTCRNWKELREIRKKILININLTGIHPYVIDVVLCAKSCFKCHRQINIKPCVICYSANFCDDHQMLFNLEHKDHCKELLLLLNINIACLNSNILHLCLDKLMFTTFPDARPYHNMITFINRYLVMEDLDNNQKKLSSPIRSFWSLEHYICSDYVSGPLTLHYALQESNLLFLPYNACKFIVHIIDSNITDVISLQVWHIFLHIFPNIKELYIIFLKPQLCESYELGTACSRCEKYNQKLYVENISETYHNYARLRSYKQPNVIMILDTNMYLIRTWFESITTIAVQKCPLLLIFNDEITMDCNIKKIQKVIDTTRNRLYRKNKFCGCRPYRNHVTGGLCYRNAHFVIYS